MCNILIITLVSVYVVLTDDFLFLELIVIFLYAFIQEKMQGISRLSL